MGTSLGVADTMALIASKLSSLVPVQFVRAVPHRRQEEMLHCRFATGIRSRRHQHDDGAQRAGPDRMGRAQPTAARQCAAERRFRSGRAARHTPPACNRRWSSPLVFNDRFIGTLAVYHSQSDFYTDDHRRLLDRVSEQASAVIHNSIVFEQTQEDSLTDALTGLPNTRYMFMHLARELARAERLKGEVALLVMDLDNFKDINDNHGHHVGDRVLRELAPVLRNAIRPYDICVRYAGDEFIVVLSGCGQDEAERKRSSCSGPWTKPCSKRGRAAGCRLAVSIGAAIFPHDGETYEALLATADSRMYRDKSRRKQQQAREQGAVNGDRGGPPTLRGDACRSSRPRSRFSVRAGAAVTLRSDSFHCGHR